MAATKRTTRSNAERPLEDENISKIIKAFEKPKKGRSKNVEKERKTVEEAEAQPVEREMTESVELPYLEVPPLPSVSRFPEKEIFEGVMGKSKIGDLGYKNRAPLQIDGRARDLIMEALKIPINLTTEDLLNVSESARQELKKLLTKKRLEKKVVAFTQEPEVIGDVAEKDETTEHIDVRELPEATYEISTEEKDGVPKGSIIVNDPVVQYLSTMSPGEKPKSIVVARESQGLRAVYPLINSVGEVESLLDGGSQIVSMAKDIAVDLKIPWDPDITVQMQSANSSLEETLGLAKNVPFLFGNITVYLQVHVMKRPAYKVLLGRPFDAITESEIKNAKDGGQSLTLTDPNTGERCVMHTHERGKPPAVMKKPKTDFQRSRI